MRLYLEPSLLVKLFKKEPDSNRMIELQGPLDERRDWYTCASRWSLLEVARALRKDGKPKELIELDLKELVRHKISLIEVTRKILLDSRSWSPRTTSTLQTPFTWRHTPMCPE